MLWAVLWLLAPLNLLAQDAPAPAAAARKVTFGVESDLLARYVWHGLAFSEGPVKQSYAWIAVGNFSAYAGGNLVLSNEPQQGEFNEVDVGVAYTHEWKRLRVEPSFDAYLSRPPAFVRVPTTGEAAVKLSYPVGRLRAFTTHTFDVVAYRGAYFGQAGGSYEGALRKTLTLGSSVALGWASVKFNEVYLGPRERAWNVLEAQVSLTYAPNKHLYLRPHFDFSRVLAKPLRQQLTAPTFGNFGVAVGVNF
ncbi:MAG: hypothetical protein U0Y68_09245 [Blastocatellia bacterium]